MQVWSNTSGDKMTHEEAKALGATHIDIWQDYYKVKGNTAWFLSVDQKNWIRYAPKDIQYHIKRGVLKPL